MLLGAGLARAWPHDRAHYFFARARWQVDDLGLAVARLVVLLLVPPGEPLTVAVDDSVFRRSGRKVYGAGWQYDGSSPSQNRVSFGTCFVTCGIVVRLPFCTRPVCLPVLARLVLPGKPRSAGTKEEGRPGARHQGIGRRRPGHPAGRRVPRPRHRRGGRRGLPRPGAEAPAARGDLDLPAARQRGPVRASRRPAPPAPGDGPAARASGWAPPASWPPPPAGPRPRSGSTAATRTSAWPASPACGTAAWTPAPSGSSSPATDAGLLALVTTDLAATAAALIERYAARWSIEQAFADARNVLGAGEARNRTRRAVERTVPFALLTCTLIITWYARHGHNPARITARRHAQPWYHAKTEPAFEDMLTQLRRVLITARISKGSGAHPTPEQTKAVLAAWHAAAA